VIVEGNMDVISSHQFNVTNVVASSGTALTTEQLGLIKRFTTNLAIAFDADSAGNAATVRGLDIARQLDFNIKLITLPPDAGKDPDDAVRKNPEIWKQAIADAKPVVEWLYNNAFRGQDSSSPEGKKAVAKNILPELARIPDPVERDAWISRLGRDLAVSEDALREAIRRTQTGGAKNQESRVRNSPVTYGRSAGTPLPESSRRQEILNRIEAALRLHASLLPLAQSLVPDYTIDEQPTEERLNYLALLADKEFSDQSIDAIRKELEADCNTLQALILTEKRTGLEQQMREAEAAGDTERIKRVVDSFAQLNERSPLDIRN